MVSLFFLFSGLDSSGLSLLSQFLLSLLLCLHLMDCLNQNSLVLKLVTLRCEVEVMVDILRDLFSLSILLEKSSEYSLSSHPKNLAWHSCVSGTLSLTTRLGVHVNVLSNNKTILEEFSDVFS